MRRVFQVFMGGLWKIRVFDRHIEPTSGGAVYVCNHQSFLDPMLMSLALRRPMNYMARHTLFKGRLFRPLIESLNAFPVQRGKADTAALKESMRRLKAGGQVVVFAEGTRTGDGRIAPLLPGVALLSQRAAEWTVPVVIEGAFEAWPRKQPLPSTGSITVRYGRPIPRSEARRLPAEELMGRIRRTMIAIQADLRRRAGRSALIYPDLDPMPAPAAEAAAGQEPPR
jgi:1-acyl-sn-glycerol-3-phosphate acyltransferase